MMLLVYFARLPYFVSVFVGFIQLFSPVFVVMNIAFLAFTLFTRGLEFTWEFWKEYLIELLRFFFKSFIFTFIAIGVSAILGTALGLSADFFTRLPRWETLRQWAAEFFY